YSIDEAFLDVTEYLPFYKKTPHEMAALLQNEIYSSLGLTASCGIGTNMYLSKIALDIMAKRSPCLTAYLDEEQFRRLLWDHRPISDFWMIASGTSSRLRKIGITCMEQLAKAPPELIMKQFGVNGRDLIEHAWGRDDTTISGVRNYVPKQRSVSHSQVIGTGCSKERGLILLREMTDELCLCLTDCGRNALSLSVYAGYSRPLGAPERINVSKRISPDNRYSVIREYTDRIYNERVPANINIHRIGVTLSDLQPAEKERCLLEDTAAEKERALQQTVCLIKKQYGKNSILKGSSYLPRATARDRNLQIGGHKA
ncbi:MAG: DNA repair protein, partial [Abditibacteriota bacterium]|nr:DNA repair protein [Abditibacteriota bacterium]